MFATSVELNQDLTKLLVLSFDFLTIRCLQPWEPHSNCADRSAAGLVEDRCLLLAHVEFEVTPMKTSTSEALSQIPVAVRNCISTSTADVHQIAQFLVAGF